MAKRKTPTKETEAWELYREIGIEKSIPPYKNAEEFARSLARELAGRTKWIISQTGSTGHEATSA